MLKYPIVSACIAVAGCAPAGEERAVENKSVKIANPASEYCIKLGGKLEIRNGESGQTGYCHLPDGRVVEEWALFRADHQDGKAN